MPDKDPRKQFGARVRFLRKKMGWSQEELAFQTGLDRTYIGGVERGERNIALLNIVRLADALRVSLPELLDFRVSD